MTYCTQGDMERNFGKLRVMQLTDIEQAGQLDATVLADAIASANAEIDSYLRARYPLPLVTVDLHLANIACDVTVYHLTKNGSLLTEEAEKRYKTAQGWLQRVADGRAPLNGAGQPAQANPDNLAMLTAPASATLARRALL